MVFRRRLTARCGKPYSLPDRNHVARQRGPSGTEPGTRTSATLAGCRKAPFFDEIATLSYAEIEAWLLLNCGVKG